MAVMVHALTGDTNRTRLIGRLPLNFARSEGAAHRRTKSMHAMARVH
jgi:hypothetical protein